jgi:hypothetical protein
MGQWAQAPGRSRVAGATCSWSLRPLPPSATGGSVGAPLVKVRPPEVPLRALPALLGWDSPSERRAYADCPVDAQVVSRLLRVQPGSSTEVASSKRCASASASASMNSSGTVTWPGCR